ncbi:MAG: CRISPR-associated endonuclease Cas2 [Firmicutes bacterium]|nr:CRISPR-associated endonuclease Cas2 [Bacillota bacterium]
MDIVVAYDVKADTVGGQRRLRKVAQQCLNYGQRVQYSVFECRVDEVALYKLKTALQEIIDAREDSVRIYRVNPSDTWVKGIDRYVNFDEPLIF